LSEIATLHVNILRQTAIRFLCDFDDLETPFLRRDLPVSLDPYASEKEPLDNIAFTSVISGRRSFQASVRAQLSNPQK
jgi:hypothetical protein